MSKWIKSLRHPGQILWWVSSASCPFLGSLTPVSEQPPCIYSCIIPRDSLQCYWWEASALVAELQQCTSNTLITSIPSQPIKIIRIFSHQNYSMPGGVQWCVGKNKDPVFFAGCFTANEFAHATACVLWLPVPQFLPFGSAYCHHFPVPCQQIVREKISTEHHIISHRTRSHTDWWVTDETL